MTKILTDLEAFKIFTDLIDQREINEAKNLLVKNPEYIATIINQIEQDKRIDKKRFKRYKTYVQEAQSKLARY